MSTTPTDRYDSLFETYATWDRSTTWKFVLRDAEIDWRLLKAQCLVESGLNPEAVSPVGAMGLGQIMPATLEEWNGRRAPGRVLDPFNPEHSIFLQAAYLEWLGTRTILKDSWPRIFCAYNWGIGNVTRTINHHGETWRDHLPAETRDYITRIAGRYADLGGGVLA